MNFLDLNYKPGVEYNDDGILVFVFKAKTGKLYYITAVFDLNKDMSDPRDIFYNKNMVSDPILYIEILNNIATEIIYRGFNFNKAKHIADVYN